MNSRVHLWPGVAVMLPPEHPAHGARSLPEFLMICGIAFKAAITAITVLLPSCSQTESAEVAAEETASEVATETAGTLQSR